jgi:hypothetical protein
MFSSPKEFINYINKKINYLEKNCYLRTINNLCANKMLKIFQDNPRLWLDVLKIKYICPCLSFIDSLYRWKDLSDNKDSIDKIINLFKLQD